MVNANQAVAAAQSRRWYRLHREQVRKVRQATSSMVLASMRSYSPPSVTFRSEVSMSKSLKDANFVAVEECLARELVEIAEHVEVPPPPFSPGIQHCPSELGES